MKDFPTLPLPAGEAPEGLPAAAAIQRAAFAVSTVEGKAVFRGLVDALAQILGVEMAFIALPDPDTPGQLRMLAFHMDGRTVEDFAYPIVGTPCETVLGQTYRCYPQRIPELFPNDADFERLGVQAYAGHPLNDGRGRALGIISAVSRRPLTTPDLVEPMLKLFGARAVTEIERIRTDAALRAAEANYREIFNAAPEPIFVHDWDTGAVLDVNARGSQEYGFTREEFLSIPLDALGTGVPPYTAADALRWIDQAKRDGAVQFEWHRRNKDGSLHWDEVRLKSVTIGGARRVLAFMHEITQRKAAEEALRSREEQYRAIFDGSGDALVLWDGDIRIVDVNAAFTTMYGYSRDEVVGGSFGDRFTPEAKARRIALIRRALDGHECQLEGETLRKDGRRFAVELRYLPITHRGEPHVLAIARDITERKEAEARRQALEAQLRQAQKMEAIGQLTGGIAHDFNNLLTSILGYTVMALERAEAEGDAVQVRYLAQTQRASQRARELIQQMLTFSRGSRGEPRPVALAPLVRESLTLLRSTLPATIGLESAIDGDLPCVTADPVQLEQVLLNLCINARDAIQGTGTIEVVVHRVAIDGQLCASCRAPLAGEFVGIAVRDSGSGIPAAVQERMFEPFFTTKDTGKGSGMGLSTAHGIVHEHGGHIVVDSAPGRGSSFRVLLPAGGDEDVPRVDGAAGVRSARDAAPLRGCVLVVDDEPMIAEYLRELLSGWGLAVTVATHPHEASAWYREDPDRVDIVVTDHAMPQQTGLELARELTLQRPDLPVLLHTGFADDVTSTVLARNGIVDLLRKPADPAQLRLLLKRHLPPAR
jgi:PAS domain S-box-containing protein